LGSGGMIGVRGAILRPYGLDVSHEPPRAAEGAQLDWRGRLRQYALVHTIAQHLGRSRRSRAKRLAYHYAGNGYHYEADEVRACVERGAGESAVMPLNDSVAVARTMDAIHEAIRRRATTCVGSDPT
jgi:hypothetical protein